MRTMTQFSVWLIYLAAKGSVYMSGCYWFSLPTFTLRNIIKSDFYFLPNRVDSRGAAQTEGQLHTYCTVLLHKRRRRWGILWVVFFIFILFSVQFSAEIWLCELLSEKFAIPESASVLPVEMGDEEEWERAKEGWTEWKKLRCEEKARKKWKREWEGGRGGEVLSEGG